MPLCNGSRPTNLRRSVSENKGDETKGQYDSLRNNKMSQLTAAQIDRVSQVIAKGEEGFRDWLTYANDELLKLEKQNIQKQYEGYFKKFITGGVDVQVYKDTRGEFEKFLMGIWECVYSHHYQAAENLAHAMLGMFWEFQFCRLSDEHNLFVYWFSKWEPLGTPRLGTGANIVEWGKPTPDVMFIAPHNKWIFGEIKHTFAIDVKGRFDGRLSDEAYMLRPSEHWRIKQLVKINPLIPFWLIIHQPEQLGRWGTESKAEDWVVADFSKLTKPEADIGSPYGRTTWVQEHGAYYWAKSDFVPLIDALKELGNAEKSQG